MVWIDQHAYITLAGKDEQQGRESTNKDGPIVPRVPVDFGPIRVQAETRVILFTGRLFFDLPRNGVHRPGYRRDLPDLVQLGEFVARSHEVSDF